MNIYNRVISFTLVITAFLVFVGMSEAKEADKSPSTSINDYKIVAENAPPYSFQDKNNKITGISIEILDLILKNLKAKITSKDVVIYSWAKAYNDTSKKINRMLLSMTRIDEREKAFKWVGPIVPAKIVIISKKIKDINIHTLRDLNNYKVGVVRGDVAENFLFENVVPKKNISAVHDLDQNIKKLDTGRIDCIAYEEEAFKWKIREKGEDFSEYKVSYVLKTEDLYFAFNRETPDFLIKIFQNALDEIKQKDEYNKIIEKY